MKNVLKIWACSFLLLMLCGCALTIGPVVERKAVIIQSGVPIEVMEQVKVDARVFAKDGETEIFRQDIGGWITFHPDHWKSLQAEVKRLQAKEVELEELKKSLKKEDN